MCGTIVAESEATRESFGNVSVYSLWGEEDQADLMALALDDIYNCLAGQGRHRRERRREIGGTGGVRWGRRALLAQWHFLLI